jgi:hypothetical protein
MKLLSTALAAILSLAFVGSARAAIIPATGATTVQLLPGLPVTPLGSTVDNGGNSFSFPVTGVEENGLATTLFHSGSGLRIADEVSIENFSYTLGSTPAFPITLFGNVNSAEPPAPLLVIDDELAITLAGPVLNFDAGTFIGDVTSIEYEATVPEPSALLLVGAAFALAGRRLRRG